MPWYWSQSKQKHVEIAKMNPFHLRNAVRQRLEHDAVGLALFDELERRYAEQKPKPKPAKSAAKVDRQGNIIITIKSHLELQL